MLLGGRKTRMALSLAEESIRGSKKILLCVHYKTMMLRQNWKFLLFHIWSFASKTFGTLRIKIRSSAIVYMCCYYYEVHVCLMSLSVLPYNNVNYGGVNKQAHSWKVYTTGLKRPPFIRINTIFYIARKSHTTIVWIFW